MKKQLLNKLPFLLSVLFFNISVYAQFTEDFESPGAASGWTILNFGDTDQWEIGNNSGQSAHSGSDYAYISYNPTIAHNDYLIGPQFTVTAETSDQLRFFAKNKALSFPDYFNVLISTSGTSIIDFTIMLDTLILPPDSWTEYTYNLSDYIGQDIYIAFQAVSMNGFELYIDDVSIEALPTCPHPIGLDATLISTNSVGLSWTEYGTATSWNIEYGEVGFTQGTGTLINGVSNPYTLTGLTEDLSYEFYVQSDCGGGDESTWVGPFEFLLDYCEVSTTSTNKYLGLIESSGAEGNITYSSLSQPVGSYEDKTEQALETYENQVVSLNTVYHRLYSEQSSVQVWVDWNKNYDFEESEKLAYSSSNSSGQNTTMTIPTGIPPGDYRMRIRGSSGTHPSACGNEEFGSTVDFTLTVLPSPVCAYPTGLDATNTSQNSVELGWDVNYGVNNWNIEYGEVGFIQGSGTIVNGLTTNTYNITGLDLNTDYEYYVQSDCGNNELSSWSGSFPFLNFYCPVSATSSTDFMSSIESSGAEVDVSYTATEQPDGSYSNETAQTFEAYETQVLAVDVKYLGGVRGTQAWIDWNGNYDFEESEKVAYTYGVSQTQTLSIPIPAGTPPGDYRMRIRSQSGSYVYPTACGNLPSGSTVDFNLTIVPSPVCAHPTGLNITNFTPATVDLIWNINYGVSKWNVEYGEAGFTQGTGTVENNITDSSYTMNISPDMEYEFYVQSDCGGGDESVWEGPFYFDTKYCEVSTVYSNEFFKKVSSNGAETEVIYSATAYPTNSYADETTQTFEVFDSQTFEMETEWSDNANTIGIWIDWNSDFDFESNELVASSIESEFNKTHSIAVPPGTPEGVYRMRVRSRWGAQDLPEPCGIESYGSTVDFTLTVIPPPTCLHPTDLNISNISGTAADLNWIENGTASTWNIEYGEAGFTHGNGTIETGVTNNPHTINISPYTDYDIYVQSDCGGGDLSTWSARYTVNLDYCSPRHVAAPYYLTSIESNGAVSDVSYTATSRPTNGYAVDTSLLFEAYPNQTFDLNTTYFDNYGNRLKVWVDWNQDYEFDATEVIDTLITAWGSGEINVFVPLGTPEGKYRMRVRAWTNPTGMETNPTACETEQLGSSVDLSLNVIPAPACLSSSALSTSNITSSSVSIDWTENGSATSWEVEYGPVGFTQGSGTLITEITSHPYTINGLDDATDYEFYVQSDCGINQSSWEGPAQFATFEECNVPSALTASNFTPSSAELGWTEDGSATSWNIEYGTLGFTQGTGTLENGISNPYTASINPETEYEFYVQSDCGGGNNSDWAGPFTFDNMYCEVLANDNSYFFKEVKSGGAISNVSYNTTTCPPGSYSNETAQVFEAYENQEIFINTTTNSGGGLVSLWVDWNNDIEFDSTELVASFASAFSSKSILITVPSGTPEGEYRMRIRGRNIHNLPIDPCAGIYFGNTAIDFTLKVVTLLTCISPTGLVATNISSTSADLEWTESGTATSWNIEYGETGFTQGTGTIENGVSSPHTVAISPNSKYEFYVQSDCGGSDESTWSGPFRFQNEYCGISYPNPTDYLSKVSSNGAVTDISYSVSSAPANSYVDKTNNSLKTFETQTFQINTTFSSTYNNIAIWVDWNEDFIFQSDELIAYVGDESKMDTLSITIPAGTPEGDYRMRVYGDYGGPVIPLPCGGYENKSIIDFTLTVVTPPSCLPPGGLTVSNITSSSADLGWIENGTATSWNIEYGEPEFTQGSGTIVNGVTNNPYTLSGLTPNNEYEFYVQSDCGGGDNSTWIGPFAFTNIYCPVISLNDSKWMSDINSSGAITDINYTATSFPLNGFADETTQIFEVLDGQTFDIKTTHIGTINRVKIWIDWNNNTVFDTTELVANQFDGESIKIQSIVVPLGTPEGEYRMRIRCSNQWSGGDLFQCGSIDYGSSVDFKLSVVAPPSCISPVDLMASNITSDAVDLSWTERGTAASWNIEYGELGFIQGTGTIENGVTNNPYSLTGLTSNTEYEFYVQSVCGGGDESTWSGPFAFTNGYCYATSGPNYYLSRINSNGGITDFNYSTTSFPVHGYVDATSKTFEVIENQLININTIYSVWANGVYIWVDWDNDQIFDNNELISRQHNGNNKKTLLITVPQGVTPGDYRMRVRSMKGDSLNPPACGYVANGSTVDFTMTVVAAPSCIPPTALNVSDITPTSADISWDEIGTANSYNIEYGVQGFVQGTGTLETGISNPQTISINPDTKYEYYMQADCGGGDKSVWVGPYAFESSYCFVASAANNIWLTDINSNGAVTDFNYTASSFPTNGYAIETAQLFEVFGNQTVTINTTYKDEANGVNIWVDWNNNMVFDFNELVASQEGPSLSKTLTFNVPVGTPEGEYRMRIRGKSHDGTNPSPCNITGWGSIVDFTLTVVPAPPCVSPSGLTATNITSYSAELGWTENGTATEWNIEFADSGFVQGSGVLVNGVSNNPYILTGLTSNTVYEYYVQSDCGGGNKSSWGGPFSFTTFEGPSEVIITDIGVDTAVVVWTDNSSASDWGIEYGPTGFTFGTGTEITTTDNPYVITGLSSNSVYDVYIWANWDYGMNGTDGPMYSARGTSLMVGPLTFVTESCITISSDSTTVCMNQPIDLDALLDLKIESQGTWLDPSGSPMLSSEITTSDPGSYNFNYLVTSGACIGETLVLDVNVDQGCDYLSVGMETMKDITVYPNPTSQKLNIVNPSNVPSLKFEMLDINGRVVMFKEQAFNNPLKTTLEMDQLAKGVYTLRVYNDIGQKIFKVVKQ